MEYNRNFSKSIYEVSDNGELSVKISGLGYIDVKTEDSLEQGLDFLLTNLDISDGNLSKIVQLIFEYFNNRNIKKNDINLDVSIILYGNQIFTSNMGVFTTKQREYSASYKKGNLVKYASYKEFKKKQYFEFVYEYGNILVEASRRALITEEFVTFESENMASLIKALPVKLNEGEMRLIKTYELFYNEKLNFSLSDTDKKILHMMYILDVNGIKIFPLTFEYARYDDPHSLFLFNMIRKLEKVNIIAFNSCEAKINEDDAKKIAVVGEVVREYINTKTDSIYALRLLTDTFLRLETNPCYTSAHGTYESVKRIREICKKDAKNQILA